jgi:hypothetical protein
MPSPGAWPRLIPSIAEGFKPESHWGWIGAEGSNNEGKTIRFTRFTALIGGLFIHSNDRGEGGFDPGVSSVHSAAISHCMPAADMG